MNNTRISALSAKEIIERLADIETDDSDAGSEYENDDFNSDEDEDFSSECEMDKLDEQELINDENEINKKIDEEIELVIRRAIGDQSTADKTSKVSVIWDKLELYKSKRVINQVKFSGKPGPTSFATRRIDSTALSAFNCIIEKSIVDSIVNSTNAEAERSNDSFRLNFEILYLFIGVLLCRGVFCKSVAVRDLWSKLYGLPIIAELMSKQKFCKIMRFMRFEDRKTRQTRRSSDKFCLIRKI